MKAKHITKTTIPQGKAESEVILPGYPLYPACEDIYRNSLEEENLDPEDLATLKEFPTDRRVYINNEKAFKEAVSGSDLDVPGSELDDQEENIGSEDEENNYYSISGDNHQDLEEDRG